MRQDTEYRGQKSEGTKILLSAGYVLLSAFLLFTVHCLLCTVHADAAETVGKFTYIAGTVDILREGAFPAKPAKLNDPVNLRDIIRTKSSSKAEITFKDNSVLRIAQRSRIDISEYFISDSSNKGVIKLSRGQAQAIVDKSAAKRISVSPGANTFEIQTPNAVAGVRGTEFFIAYDMNTTTVLLQDGDLCIYNIQIPQTVTCLPPGYIVTVSGANIPSQPRKAAEPEFKIFEKETSPKIPVPEPTSQLGGENISLGISTVAEAAKSSGQPSSLGIVSITETPSNITDVPISKPITEEFPEIVEPEPPTPPVDTSGSNVITGASIWSQYPAVSDGTFSAAMKSTETLWPATLSDPASAQITGTYSANSSLPHIWFVQNLYSYNSNNSTSTTFDGGAYRGFVGGREINNSVEALFGGLYIDPSGNTGFLTGGFPGTVSGTDLSLNGGLYPVQIGTSSMSASDFYNSIITGSFAVNTYGDTGNSMDINMTSGINNTMNISGQNDWGISQALLNGTYTYRAGDTWSLSVTGSRGEGHEAFVDLTGTKWSDNKINATGAGYWIDARTSSPSTGIYIGETIGTFNPANYTWQAIASGLWLDTNRFIQMASTAEGRNKLQQVNIPAFEVGRTNLSGSLVAGQTGSFDYVSVLMNDVIFFAPSTGQKPSVWATNSITGQYDFTRGLITPANIINTDSKFTLSNGKGISSDFQFTRWNANNKTWTANINNGTGNLNSGSYNGPVNFKGGAAGTHTGLAGSLTGTGAGVAK
jgi:hypothetical protein